MKKKTFLVSMLIAAILAACGPAPAPTLSSADIQGTALSAAWTMIAMTQAAIPTATPLPPTETPSPTPLPTFTPLPPPTLSLLPSPTAESGADPCSKAVLVPVTTGGHKIKNLMFRNKSKEMVTVSIYLAETLFGECGYRTFTLGPFDSVNFTDLPTGCYSVWAWTPKNNIDPYPWSVTCFNDTGHKSVFELTATSIKWIPP